jgi:hypothetical protein
VSVCEIEGQRDVAFVETRTQGEQNAHTHGCRGIRMCITPPPAYDCAVRGFLWTKCRLAAAVLLRPARL